MAEYYFDDAGNAMVREPAGGHGGGVTSWATRRATDEEAAAYRAYDEANQAAQASLAEPAPAAEPTAEPAAEPPLAAPDAEA